VRKTGTVPVFLLCLALAASALAQPSSSQFPSRPVKIVVPTTPGGATDALSRSIGARLAEVWGQPVVVENRPGATQIIGGEYVAKSPPDGYTLIVSDAATFIMNPILHRTLPYDGLRAFTPITLLVRFPWVVAIHPSVPATNFQEFVAYARSNPCAISYGSFGTGSSGHISVDYMKKLLGIDIVHIPYKGAGPAVTDLLAGQIQMMMVTPLLVEPHARTGKLRLIAAATPNRIPRLPELPTIAESGYPGFNVQTWNGLLAPAGTAHDIIDRLAAEVARAVKDPQFVARIEQYGAHPLGNTPQEFASMIRSESALWSEIIRSLGVKQ
jgi:tripartite-type tricarboxylate transporter receptor subunit TctC